jgi:hypothetical protein
MVMDRRLGGIGVLILNRKNFSIVCHEYCVAWFGANNRGAGERAEGLKHRHILRKMGTCEAERIVPRSS